MITDKPKETTCPFTTTSANEATSTSESKDSTLLESASAPSAEPDLNGSPPPEDPSGSTDPDGPPSMQGKPQGGVSENDPARSPDDVAHDVRKAGPTTKIIGKATITRGSLLAKPQIFWGHAANGQDRHGIYLTMTPTAHDRNKYRFGFYPMKPGYPLWWRDRHRNICIAELNKPQIRMAMESIVFTDPNPLIVNPHRIVEAAGHGDGGPIN